MRRGIWVVALASAIACGKSASKSTPACVPSDCAALGATCGAVADGCGNVVQCGACASGETCGGGGRANVCGRGPCQPATCDAVHATCGSVGDGCGGTLSCGECAAGDACGAGGTPNACAPIPPTGDVGWAFAVSTAGPDFAAGTGSDAGGNRYLLSFTWNEAGTNHTLRLQKLAPDGTLEWIKEWTAQGFHPDGFRLAVTPAGTVYLTASAQCAPWETPCSRSLDLGGGAATDSVLARLGPDGSLEWQRELTGCDVASLAADAQGSALVSRLAMTDPGPSRMEKYKWDGALLATVETYAQAVALDATGNMIAATNGAVTKYSAGGALQWSTTVPGAGQVTAAATTDRGTIVVLAARIGDVMVGSSQVRGGAQALFVLEPDGRGRFARGIAGYTAFLAVDPTGRAAVTANGTCGEIMVEAFDLSNADLWRRSLPENARCYAGTWPGPAAFGADHRLFVTGMFAQSAEVAGKTFEPRGQDAMGILLDP